MSFPNAPHPDLREWDHYACDAAIVAQILYMGGQLQYPFDTAAFDRAIRRTPGQPTVNMEGVRLIAQRLPVTMYGYAPQSTQSYADPAQVRQSMQRLGYRADLIEDYLAGPVFQLNMQRVQDDLRLQRELDQRYQRFVRPDSSKFAPQYLALGCVLAVALDSDESTSHGVLLVPSGSRPNNVTLYDPMYGTSPENLDRLARRGHIQLDETGFMAYYLP